MAMTMGMGTGTMSGGGSGWATTAVEKATSELLIGPDWTMNIDICDSLNSNYLQPKDVAKALKKRLQHKNFRVQLLAVTLLETMVKNCGENLHYQVAENLLNDLVKIVKNKTDLRVREKILIALLSWQEAFGGPGGRFPQFFWACEELRRSGVQFPKKSPDAAPIFTPPLRRAAAGYGIPSQSSRTLDEAMAADNGSLSMASLDSMREAMELLSEMLGAVNPGDREAAKGEAIADVADCCRSNQKKLMQMLTTTSDEALLGRGLELNDSMQTLLAKYDAVVSSTQKVVVVAEKLAAGDAAVESPAPESSKTVEVGVEDEEDEFALLARRHSKVDVGGSEPSMALVKVDSIDDVASSSTSATSNALTVLDAPVSTRTKEQEIIDLLSMSLATSCMPSEIASPAPATAPTRTNYVASWAQPQSEHSQQVPRNSNPHQQEIPFSYPPPPWAATPGYYDGQTNPYLVSKPSYTQARGTPLNTPVQPSGETSAQNRGTQKPFIPSYRLFEELNVLGNTSENVTGSGGGMVTGRK